MIEFETLHRNYCLRIKTKSGILSRGRQERCPGTHGTHGTEKISEDGYRRVPGTSQKNFSGYRWVLDTGKIFNDTDP